MSTSRPWRLALAGAGNVGGGVLALLDEDVTAELPPITVTGIAELGGAAVAPEGLDLPTVRRALAEGRPIGDLPGVGRPGMGSVAMLDESCADILLEATPVDLADGEPGLSTVRHALATGRHAVLANKGPLALAYRELAVLGDPGPLRDNDRLDRPRLLFSATVAGALPVVNIGGRDLAGCRITRIEGVFNGTSQYVLRTMERGMSLADAVSDAQRRGIAEADPALDIDGHDAACKLTIVANSVLGVRCTVTDVTVRSIRGLTIDDVCAPLAAGRRMVPLCVAERAGDGWELTVGPVPLAATHPMARLTPDEMGVVFHTAENTTISATSDEPGPEPASSAMLRDVLDIIRSETCRQA